MRQARTSVSIRGPLLPAATQPAFDSSFTLPKSLRQRYRIQEGDGLTLLDLGGVFVLTAGRSKLTN